MTAAKKDLVKIGTGVLMVLGAIGGTGYKIGATAGQTEGQQPPQEIVQGITEIKGILRDHAQAMESMKIAQVEMSIEAKYSRSSLDTASARIDRLTRAMDRLSYKYNLGFACENMASGPVASVKKGDL